MSTGQSESLTVEDKEQQLSEASEEVEEGVRFTILSGAWLKEEPITSGETHHLLLHLLSQELVSSSETSRRPFQVHQKRPPRWEFQHRNLMEVQSTSGSPSSVAAPRINIE